MAFHTILHIECNNVLSRLDRVRNFFYFLIVFLTLRDLDDLFIQFIAQRFRNRVFPIFLLFFQFFIGSTFFRMGVFFFSANGIDTQITFWRMFMSFYAFALFFIANQYLFLLETRLVMHMFFAFFQRTNNRLFDFITRIIVNMAFDRFFLFFSAKRIFRMITIFCVRMLFLIAIELLGFRFQSQCRKDQRIRCTKDDQTT